MVIRKPAVADMFYSGHPGTLAQDVDRYLAEAAPPALRPVALIAPHAGYVYSGPIAASAFKLLEPLRDCITRVVLAGPSHRVAFDGLATSGADAYETPLGAVPLDRPAIEDLEQLPPVRREDRAHAQEHSLEVHLPFLQQVLDRFELVPLVVGDASAEDVAEAFERAWDERTLLCISSDLSHYMNYETAREMDERTSRAIETLRPEALGRDDACGRVPIKGLLHCAMRRGWTAHRLDLRNSGDTAGSRDQVVGYGAYAFTAS